MGCEHEPDDNGLPPIDVEIPDDARELDREVQAYRRELRSERRRALLRRAFGGFRRHGPTPPLLIGILLLTALSAVILVFISRPDITKPTRSQTSSSAQVGSPGQPLPDIRVTVGGSKQALRDLSPAVLTFIPADCQCGEAAQHLAAQARQYDVPLYLVRSGPSGPAGRDWTARLGDQNRTPPVVRDGSGTLARVYGGSRLNAVLVRPNGQVSTVLHGKTLNSGSSLEKQLAPLTDHHGSVQEQGGA